MWWRDWTSHGSGGQNDRGSRLIVTREGEGWDGMQPAGRGTIEWAPVSLGTDAREPMNEGPVASEAAVAWEPPIPLVAMDDE
jgi:hypothetical protein